MCTERKSNTYKLHSLSNLINITIYNIVVCWCQIFGQLKEVLVTHRHNSIIIRFLYWQFFSPLTWFELHFLLRILVIGYFCVCIYIATGKFINKTIFKTVRTLHGLINTCITVSVFHAQSFDYLSSLPIQITATPLIHHCRSTQYGWYGSDRTTFFGWYGKPYHNLDRNK